MVLSVPLPTRLRRLCAELFRSGLSGLGRFQRMAKPAVHIGLLFSLVFSGAIRAQSVSVFFVGNSVVYVNDLPAVLADLAKANGEDVVTDMVVQGGASLALHVAAGAAGEIISNGNYDYIVLQERGGDLACFDFEMSAERCESSFAAHRELIGHAQRAGAKVVLLGTYDPHPAAARRLTQNESAIASAHGAEVVHLAPLFEARKGEAAAGWLHEDGMHPGEMMTLAAAIGLYQAIYKEEPTTAPFRSLVRTYSPRSRFDITSRASEQRPIHERVERQFSRSSIQMALDALREAKVTVESGH